MSDAAMRLDKWLWFARFCRSRSLAAKLCEAGKVRINRVLIEKPAASVKPGDVLTFPQGAQIRVVRVLALGSRRGPPIEARALYEDLAAAESA
jgi:ribosome-associated heat shock protein Hsp15